MESEDANSPLMKSPHYFFTLLFFSFQSFSQSPPWERPLKICESVDGITYTNIQTFQDSSGVPTVVRWKGDTLVAAFQWFPAPLFNSHFDKVSVKFSYDGGISWTYPQNIVVNGLPANYQRPFDPTLFVISADSLRMYFSDGPPQGFPMDSGITTHSAVSTDGINYQYEPGARFISGDTLGVIDPAVALYNGVYHFQSHIDLAQDGSYHGVSSDGLNFTRVADIPSDASHMWLGNYERVDSTLRFYGCGSGNIWLNTTTDGTTWSGYQNTNVPGADPGVAQNLSGKFYMIYSGAPYPTGVFAIENSKNQISISPNPSTSQAVFSLGNQSGVLSIFNFAGQEIFTKEISDAGVSLNSSDFATGIYLLKFQAESGENYFTKWVTEKY